MNQARLLRAYFAFRAMGQSPARAMRQALGMYSPAAVHIVFPR